MLLLVNSTKLMDLERPAPPRLRASVPVFQETAVDLMERLRRLRPAEMARRLELSANLADKVRKPFKIFSLVFFMIIVAGALAANWRHFIDYVGLVIFAVFLHNALALNLGYWTGRAAKLPERDCRATCIEVGIQNSALGLVLVFNFFEGLGGMAILVAWWGVWHIISGLTTAFILTRRKLPDDGLSEA